jgi:hypothetical protein
MKLLYFAYGSNMSTRRLRARIRSASFLSTALLPGHQMRFHKVGRDGSAKCDAYATGDADHRLIGVLFSIDAAERPVLDRHEGCGNGYERKRVVLELPDGSTAEAFTYYATRIAPDLKPFGWYREHVLRGAREQGLALEHIRTIEQVDVVDDPDRDRHNRELSIYARGTR